MLQHFSATFQWNKPLVIAYWHQPKCFFLYIFERKTLRFITLSLRHWTGKQTCIFTSNYNYILLPLEGTGCMPQFAVKHNIDFYSLEMDWITGVRFYPLYKINIKWNNNTSMKQVLLTPEHSSSKLFNVHVTVLIRICRRQTFVYPHNVG